MGIAKAAGVKYIVLTAKHCDGFLLWHSQASDYNIAQTPFQRDICAELAQGGAGAGHADRLVLLADGLARSGFPHRAQRGVPGPDAGGSARTAEQLRPDRPAVVRLGRAANRSTTRRQPTRIVKTLQPQIVINNRLDLGPGNSDRQILSPNADYYTPEQHVGAYDDQRPWESCMTTSRKGQWAWGGDEDGVKSLEDVPGHADPLRRRRRQHAAERRPDADRAKSRRSRRTCLKEMGAWLAKYGESIYGTRGGPFKPGDYGVSTRKGNTIYLHICEWTDDVLTLPAIPRKVVRSRVLGGGKVQVAQQAAGLEVSVPRPTASRSTPSWRSNWTAPPATSPAVDVPGPVSLTTGAKATASNVYQNQAEYGPDKAVDGHGDTRWATDSGVTSAWLEVDLGKPVTFSRAASSRPFRN